MNRRRNFFGDAFNKVEGFFSSAFNTFSNDLGGAEQILGKIPGEITSTANNVIDTVGHIGEGLELILVIPLALAGLAVFFLFKNASPNTISDVSGNIAKAAPLAAL